MNEEEKVSIAFTRTQWSIIQQVIWKLVPCEVGVPLFNTIKQHLDGEQRKAGNNKFLSPADD